MLPHVVAKGRASLSHFNRQYHAPGRTGRDNERMGGYPAALWITAFYDALNDKQRAERLGQTLFFVGRLGGNFMDTDIGALVFLFLRQANPDHALQRAVHGQATGERNHHAHQGT